MNSSSNRFYRSVACMSSITSLACLASLMFVAAAVHAAPEINIGEHFDYLESGKTNFLKRIRNTGSSTAFVEINVSELKFDEKTGETHEVAPAAVSMKQGAAGQSQGTLVASPQRLIVPAGGAQATRLVFLGPRDQERYYRVRFSPVSSDKHGEFGADPEQDKEKNISAGVTMMVGYGAIFTVRPDQPVYDTKFTEVGNAYRFVNRGNSTIVLREIYSCDAAEKNCQSLGAKRVRPGRMTELAKSPGHSYSFDLVEGENKKPMHLGGAK